MFDDVTFNEGDSLVREKKALFIRDNVGHVNNIRRALQESDCSFLMVDAGFGALMLAKQFIPDLILVDIQPPAMEGLEVIRSIRTSGIDQLERVPVIGITKEDFSGELYQEIVSSGINEVIESLAEIEEVQSRVSSLI